jgi:hypothetical protein
MQYLSSTMKPSWFSQASMSDFILMAKNTELARRAFHGAPAIIVRLVRNVEVDARPVAGAQLVLLSISIFHSVDAGFHVEDLGDMLVGQKNHCICS